MPFAAGILKSAVVLTLLGTTLEVPAALTVYTTSASFLAAVTDAGMDTFDDLDLDFLGSPVDRTAGGHGYSASADGFFVTGPGVDHWLSTNHAFDPIVFASFTPETSAIGGYFFATDLSGSVLDGESVVLTALDTGSSAARTLVGPTPQTFLGFVSDAALVSLTVATVDTGSNATFATVNSLTLASPVPEAGTLSSILAGVALIAAVKRRRR